MEVNIKQALKMFFSNSSFEMIYFEAFANALDAEATEFNIDISMSNESDWKNMAVTISDNGVGFNDVRFGKFSKLFDVEEQSHKGLGRLVYLCYFDEVCIESVFENTKKRTFIFNDTFDKDCRLSDVKQTSNGTIIKLRCFNGERLGKKDYINPHYIKKSLLENFYMKFYKAKLAGKSINVNIESNISGGMMKDCISTSELPNFCITLIPQHFDLTLFISS